MADRELKKLSRAELIDIIYALKEREEDLSAQVAALEERLAQREIQISRAAPLRRPRWPSTVYLSRLRPRRRITSFLSVPGRQREP